MNLTYSVFKRRIEKHGEKGYISFLEEAVERNPADELEVCISEPKTPTAEQKKALDAIREKSNPVHSTKSYCTE